MEERLPNKLPRRFLVAAIDDLDSGIAHPFGASTGYDLLYLTRRYPPKAVVALALTRFDGRVLRSEDFRGGLRTPCFRILERAGFAIVAKDDADAYSADLGGDLAEGDRIRVEVNRYERDPRARRRCIAHHGSRCAVCELDFGERYGLLGKGFIHVHHRRPLSTKGGPVTVDPVTDLTPVCPNCHAMLHRRIPPLAIDELRELTPPTRASPNPNVRAT